MFGDDQARIQNDDKQDSRQHQNSPPNPGIIIQKSIYRFSAFFEIHKYSRNIYGEHTAG
jgi:hypothetical protein